jgi:threonine/homoserine/homoserine lactone efflux protein
MIMTLLSSSSFLTFLVASLLLAIAPGPGVMYLLTRTLSLGRAAGLASVGGVAIGNLANAALASLGLAALMAASAAAFTVVKFAGAAYLVFLAVQTLRAQPEAAGAAGTAGAVARVGPPTGRIFRDGFLVALLNPKTALFFAALLPQFIVPGVAPLPQTLLLGLVFVAVAVCTDTLYVCAAAAFARQLKRHAGVRGVGRYLAAATFLGLAAYAAFANQTLLAQPKPMFQLSS